MSGHIFVDETKRAGYVIAAVTVADPEAIRKVVRALVLPGQRRIHMKHEQARRRRTIVSAPAATDIQATVYDAARRYRTDLAARAACLDALVEDIAVRAGNTRLIIEQDDSIVRADRHDLFRLTRQAGIADRLEYRHQRAYDELLLAAGHRGMELGPVWGVASPDQSDPDHRPYRLTLANAKPERRVRPDGSRAQLPRGYCCGQRQYRP